MIFYRKNGAAYSVSPTDYLDSRDLIETAEEIFAMDEDEQDDEDRELLDAIRALEDEGIEDWEYGATLIPATEFVSYAQEFAEDIGAVDSSAAWPLTCIDWEEAARMLKMDYTSVTFMGTEYYVR